MPSKKFLTQTSYTAYNSLYSYTLPNTATVSTPTCTVFILQLFSGDRCQDRALPAAIKNRLWPPAWRRRASCGAPWRGRTPARRRRPPSDALWQNADAAPPPTMVRLTFLSSRSRHGTASLHASLIACSVADVPRMPANSILRTSTACVCIHRDEKFPSFRDDELVL